MGTSTLRTSQNITMIHWHKLYLYEHKVINQLWGPPHSVIYWHNSIYIFIFEHNVISQLWGPPDLEHPKTLDTTYIYIYMYLSWSIDTTIFIWTQSHQSAAETPTLRTSQDITTYMYICVMMMMMMMMIYWHNSICMNTKLSTNCGDPHT